MSAVYTWVTECLSPSTQEAITAYNTEQMRVIKATPKGSKKPKLIAPFALYTTPPKSVFADDAMKTLDDLGLAPAAVINLEWVGYTVSSSSTSGSSSSASYSEGKATEDTTTGTTPQPSVSYHYISDTLLQTADAKYTSTTDTKSSSFPEPGQPLLPSKPTDKDASAGSSSSSSSNSKAGGVVGGLSRDADAKPTSKALPKWFKMGGGSK